MGQRRGRCDGSEFTMYKVGVGITSGVDMSEANVRKLPLALRAYLGVVYLSCVALVVAQARPLLTGAGPAIHSLAGITPWYGGVAILALAISPILALHVTFKAMTRARENAATLRRRGEQLEAVLAAGQSLRLQQSQANLLQPAAEAARALVAATTVTAYLRDPDVPGLLERILLNPGDATEMGPAYLPVPTPNQGIQRDETRLLVPLESHGGDVVGLLVLMGVAPNRDDEDHGALTILAAQTAVALNNADLHERALAQASEDGLTGLPNHRTFQTRLEEEVARARRGGRPLALIMVDIDDFRTVNNTYGHQIGDATLVAIATALRGSVRGVDVAARYGGDEFAVIMPETNMIEAYDAAERAHAAIAGLDLTGLGVSIRLGASVGVATLPMHAMTREDLVHAADQAAYAAKHQGKGRVGRPEEAILPLDRDPIALTAQLVTANMATVEALAAAVDAKDPYTRGHSQRVAGYAEAIARAMGLPAGDVARVRLSGQLHDVGKIGVPDAILTKPGALNDAEFAILKQHPAIGERMLAAAPFLQEILPAVRHHHERWDGRGYPDGLKDRMIPRDAAILAVADSFDAMTSSRTYRPALSLPEARRRLREGSGTQFDATVVAAFERAYAEGILTPLSSGGTTLLNPNRIAQAS
jgi:diguanylate cyclase (GGDEF)-like protein